MVIEMPSMKSGDAADEILGRPAFHYVKEKAEVELTLVSAAELGIPPNSRMALPAAACALVFLLAALVEPRVKRPLPCVLGSYFPDMDLYKGYGPPLWLQLVQP
jgi:hypothetical protein